MPGQLKAIICLLAGVLALLGSAGAARAFHDGGVAACEGCHTMHNSAGSQSVTGNLTPTGQANPFLLLSSSASGVCLNCHEGTASASYRVATSGSVLGPGQPPVMMTPGGDFAWLKKSYSWLSGATLDTEAGDRHGHNIVAPDFGYFADTTPSAPGGFFPAGALSCTSCHDPHGRYRILVDGSVATTGAPIADSGSYSTGGLPVNPSASGAVGSYRMLAGIGYQPQGSSQPFFNNPPAAMAPLEYNRSEAVTQTRVAYGAGTSRWCANCHGQMHDDSSSTFRHRFEETLGGNVADHYNAYVKTGDPTGGSYEAAFLSLVPFESGLTNAPADRNTLAALARSDDGNLTGPSDQDRVSCLSCHRGHASGWRHMLRWNHRSEFLTYNGYYPGLDNGAPAENHMGRTEAETRRAYYDRPASVFGANQIRLCEKCHVEGVRN